MQFCNVSFNPDILKNPPRQIGQGGQGVIQALNHPRDPGPQYVRKVYKDYPSLVREANMGILTNNLPHLPQFWGGCISDTHRELFFLQHKINLYALRQRLSPIEVGLVFEGVFRQMCDAVMTLEYLNVVHTDIKPDNIMCDDQPLTFTLIDFGYAHLAGHQMVLKGTAGYLPPEIFLDDEQSTYNGLLHDVWSLGVTFVDFLINDYTFSAKTNDYLTELSYWSGVQDITNLHALPPTAQINVQAILNKHGITGVHPKMVEAIQNMLTLNPNHRKLLRDYIPLMFKGITPEEEQQRIAIQVADNHIPINLDQIKYVLQATNVWRDLLQIISQKYTQQTGVIHPVFYSLIGLEIVSRWCRSPETVYQLSDLESILVYVHLISDIRVETIPANVSWEILVDIYFQVYNVYITPALHKLAHRLAGVPSESYISTLRGLSNETILDIFRHT